MMQIDIFAYRSTALIWIHWLHSLFYDDTTTYYIILLLCLCRGAFLCLVCAITTNDLYIKKKSSKLYKKVGSFLMVKVILSPIIEKNWYKDIAYLGLPVT